MPDAQPLVSPFQSRQTWNELTDCALLVIWASPGALSVSGTASAATASGAASAAWAAGALTNEPASAINITITPTRANRQNLFVIAYPRASIVRRTHASIIVESRWEIVGAALRDPRS